MNIKNCLKFCNTENILRCILITILIIAALLRFIGTNPGYPPFHSDEGITYSQGIAMIQEFSLNPKNGYGYAYNYPIVVPLINALFYLFIFIPNFFMSFFNHYFADLLLVFLGLSNAEVSLEKFWTFDRYIFGEKGINILFWGRYTTAFFGVLIVWITYLVGKKLFNNTWIGLLSAYLTAINYRLVLNSHIGLPDIYNTFFLMMVLLFLISLWEKQTLKYFLLVGLSTAIYFSTKFQVFALPPLAITLFIILQKKPWIEKVDFLKSKNLWLMFVVMLFLIIVLNIFHIIHYKETLDLVGYTALKYRYGRSVLDFYPISYIYHILLGPITSVIFLSGIIFSTIYNFRKSFFLLSVIIPILWYLAYYTGGGFYTRNLLTITPAVLIFVAYSLYTIISYIKGHHAKLAVIIGFFILTIISWESLKNSLLVPIEYSKPWNFQIVQKWIDQNIPEGESIALNDQGIFQTSKYKVTYIHDPQDYILSELQDKGIQWAIINSEWINSSFYWWMNQGTETSLKFWKRPTEILLNSPITKMTQELKNYTVFEALKPWQAPDYNLLVIKVPPKNHDLLSKRIYEDSFDKLSNWEAVNDGFGDVSNFYWDSQNGFLKDGSIKIAIKAGGFYSQRFVSHPITITEKKYQIKGMLKASGKVDENKKACLFGVDILDKDKNYLTSFLSSRISVPGVWIENSVITKHISQAKYIKIFLQTNSYDISNCWLDDIEMLSLTESREGIDSYIDSQYNPEIHLLPFSNGGM